MEIQSYLQQTAKSGLVQKSARDLEQAIRTAGRYTLAKFPPSVTKHEEQECYPDEVRYSHRANIRPARPWGSRGAKIRFSV